MKLISIKNSEFNPYPNEIDKLSLVLVQENNIIHNQKYIESLINDFNQKYKWDGMFDFYEANNRILNGHKMYLLFFDNQEIGYVWIKEITKDICFAYNLFVSKHINRPDDSPKWLLSTVYREQLKIYKEVQMEIEDWHTTTFNIVYSLIKTS